jgi:hypothetical protein
MQTSHRRSWRFRRLFLALAAALAASGCAGLHRSLTAPTTAPAVAPPSAPLGDTPATGAAETPTHHQRCQKRAPEEEALLDESRRRIAETFCGATLWFDGLFGGQPDIKNARAVSGRIELSTLYTEADGAQPKARLRLNYDLPNLKHRVSLFLGRDEGNEFERDRVEGFAIRSSVFGVETEDRWLAGLGYAPPGKWAERIDFRVGGRLGTAPEAFAQGRLRRNLFVGDRSVWRLRETVFYENRDGFGSTSSVDFDRVVRRDLLFRWGNVGTFSEATTGFDWRSAVVLYQNFGSRQAMAYELFVRGATDLDVAVREYGARAVYRRTLNRRWLYGEVIGGYTWPRESADRPREGSTMVGIGVELLFGRQPF